MNFFFIYRVSMSLMLNKDSLDVYILGVYFIEIWSIILVWNV